MDRPLQPLRTAPTALLIALLLQACSGALDTTATHDGVYDRPANAPVAVAAAVEEPAPTAVAEQPKSAEADYYNAAESQRYTDPRNYYDMTYNDPYYYNYGRFGFGMGVGMGSWGNGWGMGTGWGSPGWNDPYWNNSWQSGYGSWGWNNGWGWNSGWGSCWSCSPYGWNSGWGPYYGYGGNCWGCYQPMIIWDGTSSYRSVVAHRGSMGGGGPVSGGNRAPIYNPVGLRGQPEQRARIEHRPVQIVPGGTSTRPQARPGPMDRPSRTDPAQRPGRVEPTERPSRPTIDQQPSRGMDRGTRGGGGFSSPAPSRSGGGRR
ncbi:MAG: hypothetical protein IPJ87_18125 [Flavobacteriales bacterium]|nr:hypothetical protein [Flavobacteriales bacterium]MBK7943764.1 hypothetical protein [Flavobacteriales bacterium]MBK9699555.1 hypothetical protein [Flavobacteriales bacterium]